MGRVPWYLKRVEYPEFIMFREWVEVYIDSASVAYWKERWCLVAGKSGSIIRAVGSNPARGLLILRGAQWVKLLCWRRNQLNHNVMEIGVFISLAFELCICMVPWLS